MKLLGFRFLGVLLWTLVGLTQLVGQGVVDRAIWFWDAGQTDMALQTIRAAVEQGEDGNPEVWYVLGYFEKEIYKRETPRNPDSQHREEALKALMRAQALQPSGETAEQVRQALKYLAQTYFKDAAAGLAGFSPGRAEGMSVWFNAYVNILVELNPADDLRDQKAEWERQMGQAFNNWLSQGLAKPEDEIQILAEAVGHYERSLVHQPGHYSTLYNLAIALYNHGVRQLKRIGPETSMFELMEIQDVCVALFEEALPLMEQAHALRPNRLETLKGLMTIHYALSQPEPSEKYRQQLEAVIRAGGGG